MNLNDFSQKDSLSIRWITLFTLASDIQRSRYSWPEKVKVQLEMYVRSFVNATNFSESISFLDLNLKLKKYKKNLQDLWLSV